MERAPATSGPRPERLGHPRARVPKSARGVLAAVVLATTSLITAPSAFAEPSAAVEVSPPKIRSAPEVTLPPGEAPTEPVAVELELAIDQEGRVTAASVVT